MTNDDLGGRPEEYCQEYAEQARKLARLGATMGDIADFFGVNIVQVYRWRNRHEEFCNALTVGQDLSDDRVERALYERAVGYDYERQSESVSEDGDLEVRTVRTHVPPDVGAAKLWLTNRRPETWSETKKVISSNETLTDAFGTLISQISGTNRIGPMGRQHQLELAANEQYPEGARSDSASDRPDDVTQGDEPLVRRPGSDDTQARRQTDAEAFDQVDEAAGPVDGARLEFDEVCEGGEAQPVPDANHARRLLPAAP